MGDIKYEPSSAIDIEDLARQCCKDVGYDSIDKGLDYRTVNIITNVGI